MPKILHFVGEGYGFMTGVKEYFVFVEDDANIDEQCAPGFKLENQEFIDEIPSCIPEGDTLVRRE